MKSLIIAMLLITGLPLTEASAASNIVRQTAVANVYGIVEVGQSQPLSVSQTGRYNVVGVVQAGNTNAVGVLQSGVRNTALISQMALPSASRFRGEMP
jgi:hypothetical protein